MMNAVDMKGIDQLPSGRWRVRLQHRGETIGGTETTAEAAAALRDAMKRRIADDELVPTKGASAKLLGPRFLASRSGNRDTKNDESRWHTHLAPAAWARLPVSSVTRADGLAWLVALKRTRTQYDPAKQGQRDTNMLSRSTRHHCVVLARRFFAWALDQEAYGVTANPFANLLVEREDGDEDGGYQDDWYLELEEQRRFLATWDSNVLDLTAAERDEKWIAQFAIGTGLRESEQWCLHLADFHVDDAEPHVIVRFGSWDPVKRRYRSPKGRKGEKKSRRVPLFGLGLEAARAWLELLPSYAPQNPLGLLFPTERGALRSRPPRTWKAVVERFGALPRIGGKIWWHLLRHTFASSLVAGAWGMRWPLEDVSRALGHTDVRTTQIYAHFAPSVLQETASRAQAAYLGSRREAAKSMACELQ